jgi:hypothetical protein
LEGEGKGERLENIHEKRLQLLKNYLFIYESEEIQCQIIFQHKTITFNVIYLLLFIYNFSRVNLVHVHLNMTKKSYFIYSKRSSNT